MQKAIITISKGCRRGFSLTILKIMRDLAAIIKFSRLSRQASPASLTILYNAQIMVEAVLKRNQPDLVRFSRDYLSARSGKKRDYLRRFRIASTLFGYHIYSRGRRGLKLIASLFLPRCEMSRRRLARLELPASIELDFPKSSAIFALVVT